MRDMAILRKIQFDKIIFIYNDLLIDVSRKFSLIILRLL